MAQGARGIEDAFRKGQHGGGIVIDNLTVPAQQKLSRDEQRKLKELEEGICSSLLGQLSISKSQSLQ